jgi:hypothetical protein
MLVYQRVVSDFLALRLERQTSQLVLAWPEKHGDEWITRHVAKQSTPNWFLPAQQHVVSYFG